VAAYPQVPFILGHGGGRPDGHRAAVELAQRYPHVYLDLSGDSYYLGLVEWLVKGVGAERVLYASDLTWIDPRTQLARVWGANLPDAAKSAILYDNARQLFHLPRAQKGKS
jgi:predicted TIM-barrel fold metal-dependent hydrolase